MRLDVLLPFFGLVNAAVYTVTVGIVELDGKPGLGFDPSSIRPAVGDTITFTFALPEYVKNPTSTQHSATLDNILAVNDHALHAIEGSDSKSPSALSVFWPFSTAPATREVIREAFVDAMGTLSNQMARVVLEAEASIIGLNDLEERLQTLHDIVTREDGSISAEKDEVLAQLWTKVGGNRRVLKGLDGHLFLLKGVGGYRERARAHVVAALHAVQGMSEDMEDMRERVSAPELTGEHIPVEVHIKSIKAGLERLTQKRLRAQEREEEAVRKVLGIEDE
ncbi:hypothetical protein EIP91_001382 [Steccherinum ochraceum]|uniref:Uncharacterized protein n=1 Tax=Steccherinum ochraceum TaxID=92696 RepID=A0A4R0RKI4_9APHY|nr:hypothetical protein EIP91_001382 [Steccherinum ochraceum]